MDTTPYFPPPAPQRYGSPGLPPEPPATRPPAPAWVKVLAIVLTTAVSVPFALVTGFIALIEYTGCFIGCRPEDANPLGGLGLAALAALLCAAGPLLAAQLYRSRGWLFASMWVAGAGSVSMFAVFAEG